MMALLEVGKENLIKDQCDDTLNLSYWLQLGWILEKME